MSKQTIDVTVNLTSTPISGAGFGTPLLLVEAESSVFSTRTKIYSDLTSVASDFASTTAEYAAAQSLFLQTNPPAQLKIGRMEAADATLTAALDAIKSEDNDWYFLLTMTRTSALVLLAAAWAEVQKKFYVFAEAAVAVPIMVLIEALGYNRSMGVYHSTADGTASDVFADVGWVARMAVTDPGSTYWAEKAVVGVTADTITTTEMAAVDAVYGNYFVDTPGGTLPYNGKVASGEWADVIRFADWQANELATRIFALKLKKSAANSKIPYTSKGLTMIEGEIFGAMNAGVTVGGLASFTITIPDVANVSDADKLSRTLNNTSTTGVLAGAIIYVNLTLNLEV